ncbi:hypothetical protein B6V72_09570 [Thioclava sp. F34-6]|uniref:helix-turn-helix transcriptional regulator n=1 Tax=Thioclava sp. F34-6 TaxID=1973003 RepID=UPI000B54176F|nr:helix-turn-helix transcriptional regulator [Thioclava sp. F34-6]OWY13046.1 hypothetical protein B6V72_09570 [Thioclava sp. F34-6]
MTVHDFAFILDADPHDEAVEDIFMEHPFDDATLILQNGALALSFDREGESFKSAVLSAYQDIRNTDVPILSFEPDYLVTSAEIARRVGLSRSAISKYEHSDIGFPAPVKQVLAKRPMYDWVRVSRWFVGRGEMSEVEYHKALISRVMNFGTQAQSTMKLPVDVPKLVNDALEAAG